MHVHVHSLCDTHVAKCVSRVDGTCTCVSNTAGLGVQHGEFVGAYVLSAQRASTCALLRFHQLGRATLSQSVQGREDPLRDFVDLTETIHLD
jgi:hypothetical protein